MNIRLDGRTALVCGSSQGIGKAIAEQFAEMGANVILIARDINSLNEVATALHRSGAQRHWAYSADLQRPNEASEIIKEHISEFGHIHILVNNSGGPPAGLAIDAAPGDFTAAFERHLHSSQLFTQAVFPGMKADSFGRIINIISISVRQPIENLGVSNTLRGAMASWAKTLSRELGRFGITVNNILPGHTATKRLQSLIATNAQKSDISYDELQNRMLAEIPAGRFGFPEEPAYLAGFLASDYASFINGVSIPVDGGFVRAI